LQFGVFDLNLLCFFLGCRWVDQQGAPLGGDSVDRAFISEWLMKVDAWDGNLFVTANSSAGGVVKFSTKFKIKVAEANMKRNPELADVYTKKIGEMNRIMNEPADTAKVQLNWKQLEALLDEAEARLSSSKFLAGEEYSAADAIFTPVLFRVGMAKKDELIASKTNIQRYYEELKKRPSFKKVFCVSNSGIATAGLVLPALGKIFLSKVTGKY
jgi:glutathione S-transferase